MQSTLSRVCAQLGLGLALVAAGCGGTEEAPLESPTVPVTAPPVAPPPTAPPGPPAAPAPPPVPPVIGCDMTETAAALEADNLVAIVRLLSEDIVTGSGEDTPTIATAFDARTALCPEGCDSTEPFITRFTPSDTDARVHLVVPGRTGGFFVLPQLAIGSGLVSRCTDELRADLRVEGELVRLHVTSLVNELLECDRDGDGNADEPEGETPCLSGCVFRDRTDREILISPATGRYVSITRQHEIGEGEVEGVDRLANVPIRVEGTAVLVQGCPADRRVVLTD